MKIASYSQGAKLFELEIIRIQFQDQVEDSVFTKP